jgi:hypothetical protein
MLAEQQQTEANGPKRYPARCDRFTYSRHSRCVRDAGLRAGQSYGVAPKVLLQGVRRNRKRFPSDFMFQLSNQEVTGLRSQIVTSSLARNYGGRRAFTEHGAAMGLGQPLTTTPSSLNQSTPAAEDNFTPEAQSSIGFAG